MTRKKAVSLQLSYFFGIYIVLHVRIAYPEELLDSMITDRCIQGL